MFELLSSRSRIGNVSCIDLNRPPGYAAANMICHDLMNNMASSDTVSISAQSHRNQLRRRQKARLQRDHTESNYCKDIITISSNRCRSFLNAVDFDRNHILNRTEYVWFIDRLKNPNRFVHGQYEDVYESDMFSELPCNLIENFQNFESSVKGQIDISGGKPGQAITEEQAAHIAALCCQTDLAMKNPVSCRPAPEPSMVPENVIPSDCIVAMSSSDFNRDNYLNKRRIRPFPKSADTQSILGTFLRRS